MIRGATVTVNRHRSHRHQFHPVFTGHYHQSHRSPPATVTGPHRSPSSVPSVSIGLCHHRTSQCHYDIESIGIVGIGFD